MWVSEKAKDVGGIPGEWFGFVPRIFICNKAVLCVPRYCIDDLHDN